MTLRIHIYATLVRPALVFAAAAFFGGCATSGFELEHMTSTRYPPSTDVELLRHEPAQPYLTLAKFQGAERSFCRSDEPYCSLEAEARRLGANAIWVQQTRHWTRPEQWLMIDNEMKRIPEATYETIEGVMVRYRD